MICSRHARFILASVLLVCASLSAQKRTPSIHPSQPEPQSRPVQGVPGSVILKSGNASEEVKRIPVLRSYALGDLRQQSVLRFGDRQIDLKPLLNNSHAVANVAARMQAAPQLVKVMNSSARATEVAQGVIVESDLQFSFAAGACSGPSRSAVDDLGVHCPERASMPGKGVSQLDRAVPMSHLSATVVATNRAKYASYYKQQDTLLSQRIAAFRAALKNPQKKSQLVAAVGQSTVDQMNALTDDQIKDNIANAGVQHVHETLFVPKAAMGPAPDKVLALGANAAKPSKAAPTVQTANQTTKQTLGPDIYLTGFTLGNSFEWQSTINFEIDPCILGLDLVSNGLASVVTSIFGVSGCPMHSSITPYAYLDVGFGMRFPIRTSMPYVRQINGKKTTANVQVNFQPFNGSADDYKQAGLQQGQIFDGHEFVAEIKAGVGVGYDLPILGRGSVGPPELDLDLTQYLPAPFTGGDFAPPAPGSVLNSAPIEIAQVDLLMNFLDFAVLQGTLNPAVELGVTSKGLSFDLVDKMKKTAQEPNGHLTHLTQSGTTVPLSADAKDHSTDFLLTNPVYNFAVQITPGVVFTAAVDLGVWSQTWNVPIWFPQLAIDIPPNGINFSCHDGTICTHEYQQTANQAKVGEVSQAEVVKAIQAQGCDGPGSDNQFYCRSNAAWDYCLAHVSSTSYKGCGLDTQDMLNGLLSQFDCQNGYCLDTHPIVTSIGCPNGQTQCSKETNVQACTRVVSDPGMQKFGYTRCCLDPSKNPGSSACSSGHPYKAAVIDTSAMKLIQTQCDGPSSDTHEFYCHSLAAGTSCQNHISQLPTYKCGTYLEGILDSQLIGMNCKNGHCQSRGDIQACQSLVTSPGYKAYGYERCCPASGLQSRVVACVPRPVATPNPSAPSDAPGGPNSNSSHAPRPNPGPRGAAATAPPPAGTTAPPAQATPPSNTSANPQRPRTTNVPSMPLPDPSLAPPVRNTSTGNVAPVPQKTPGTTSAPVKPGPQAPAPPPKKPTTTDPGKKPAATQK